MQKSSSQIFLQLELMTQSFCKKKGWKKFYAKIYTRYIHTYLYMCIVNVGKGDLK